MTTHSPVSRRAPHRLGAALLACGALALAACGGGPSSAGAAKTTTTTAPAGGNGKTTITGGGGQVLPVTSNPIHNSATAKTLRIDSVLVENNVDASGKAADDHLEIALANSGSTDLSGVEVYYTYTDPTAGTSESYYAKLPARFTIPAGGTRVAHFDTSGATDHFPVNKFSLYYTSTNALDVQVIVSAQGAAVQTTTVHKDAGGAEVPD